MARAPAVPSLDSVVRDAVRPLVERASAAIAKSIALIVAEQLESKLRESAVLNPKNGAKSGAKRGRSAVAKYGENATFQKGKPLPKAA